MGELLFNTAAIDQQTIKLLKFENGAYITNKGSRIHHKVLRNGYLDKIITVEDDNLITIVSPSHKFETKEGVTEIIKK